MQRRALWPEAVWTLCLGFDYNQLCQIYLIVVCRDLRQLLYHLEINLVSSNLPLRNAYGRED